MRTCATCGFLYAVCESRNVSSKDDVNFDPDLFRESPSDTVDPISTAQWLRAASSQVVGGNLLYPPLVDYNGGNTKEIRCLWGVFPPIDLTPIARDARARQEVATKQVHETDMTACSTYFQYHPSLSAREHIELKIQTQRDEVAQKLLESLAEREREFTKEMKDREHRLNVLVGAFTAVNICVAAIMFAQLFRQ